MPAKEIKELRQAGKIDEAYAMALAELEVDTSNIWAKRNLSWVLYSQLDAAALDLDSFLLKIEEVKRLELPIIEDMFFDTISVVISKAARSINSATPIDQNKLHRLFDAIKDLPLKRKSKWYSVLFSAFQKGMKESSRYIEFADWWDFDNFLEENYLKEKMANGKDIMSIVEQAYISYSKHLLNIHTPIGVIGFNKDKVVAFLPKLEIIVENYPDLTYGPYFKAKLLLALGDSEHMLSALLPFAKKKKNDFWVWDIFSEAFKTEPEKVFACYCKALSCKSPEEMLVNLRQRMAAAFIQKEFFNEAKTEIEILVKSKIANGFRIPNEVVSWQNENWYRTATSKPSNLEFYKEYTGVAEGLLFSDVPEENIIVEFVNSDRKILNFIASETKFGFFKYDRFLKNVKVGDILKVRFQSLSNEGLCQFYTVTPIINDEFKVQFMKEVEGELRIQDKKSFGFINNVFIHPSIITKNNLTNGGVFKGVAMKSYNKEKKQWGWKLL